MSLAILCIPAFALADRLFGADRPKFPGKKAVILALVLGAGYLAGAWLGAALGAAWFAYRTIPFFNGSGAPETPSQIAAAAIRHGLIVPIAALIVSQLGGDTRTAAIVFAVYAALATAMAIAYGVITADHRAHGEPGGDENAILEVMRGALYGGAVYMVLA